MFGVVGRRAASGEGGFGAVGGGYSLQYDGIQGALQKTLQLFCFFIELSTGEDKMPGQAHLVAENFSYGPPVGPMAYTLQLAAKALG